MGGSGVWEYQGGGCGDKTSAIAQKGRFGGDHEDIRLEPEVTTIRERSSITKRDYWWISRLLDLEAADSGVNNETDLRWKDRLLVEF